jgi:hypothetical protein
MISLAALALAARAVAAPTVVSATGHSSMDKVVVLFDVPMDPASAANPANYRVRVGNSDLAVTGATLRPEGNRVILNTAAQAEGVDGQVVVNNVRDGFGIAVTPDTTVSFRTFVFTPGLVRFEAYDLSDRNVLDLSVSVLTSHPSFPDHPRDVLYIRGLDTTYAYPDSAHDNYGSRMTGVFVPPQTGNWIFYLRSDDASQLWFNPDGISDSGRQLIAEETTCCHVFSANASSPLPLVAGHRYYIETLHREGPEFDFCEVAAKLDTDPANPDYLFPIGHASLGVFADPTGASITAEPAHNALGILPPGVTDPILKNWDFQGGDGGFTVESINPLGPWVYDGTTRTWVATGHKECSPSEASMLRSPAVTVDEPGEIFAVFRHRYNFENYNLAHDGGQLRLSVNGGDYTTVPGSSFLAGGYNGTVQGENILKGQEAFIGGSVGQQSGNPVTSVVSLGVRAPGDTLSLEFLGAWDFCQFGYYPNWELRNVWITHTVTKITIDAAGSRQGEPDVPVAREWQMDTGSGFRSLDLIEDVLWLAPGPSSDRDRFRALLTIPGASLISEPVTLRMTHVPTCSAGGPYAATCGDGPSGLVVHLDASGSSDADGDALSYQWSAQCPGAVIDNPTGVTAGLSLGAGFSPGAACSVSLTVTDEPGASSSCTATVDTTRSAQLPTIVMNGGDQTFACDSGATNQYVEPGATALDACGRSIPVSVGGGADTRHSGVQVVTYNATDVFGNAASQVSRTVTVQADPAVLANVPDNLVTECSAIGGASATDAAVAAFLNSPVARNGCDPDQPVPASAPAFLPLGATPVSWTIPDGTVAGASATRTVTVRDTTGPRIQACGGEFAVQAGPDGTGVVPDLRGNAGVSDLCTAAAGVTFTQDPPAGTVLSPGQYTVTLTARDNATPPNTTTCTGTLDVTAVLSETPALPGCGTPACGNSGAVSLAAGLLGLWLLRARSGRV